MAWLRLMRISGRVCLVNSDQISDVYEYDTEANAAIRGVGGITIVRETVDEIAAMIADAERRERLDGMFKAIVCNFPHGYDPAEIVETARRLLDALDKSREE